MAEALLRHRLPSGWRSTPRSSSAGPLYDGAPGHATTAIEAMADRGLDLARPPQPPDRTPSCSPSADLVIGMARSTCARRSCSTATRCAKTFTLKELVRRAEADRRRAAPSRSPTGWPASAPAGRPRRSLGVGHDDADDVDDPLGRARAVLRGAPPTTASTTCSRGSSALVVPAPADAERERTA